MLCLTPIAYVKRLRAVGFTEEQAEVQADVMTELIEEGLATKRDIRELELKLSVRLGTIMAAGIAAVAAIVKIISH
jgi:hypothetical protein